MQQEKTKADITLFGDLAGLLRKFRCQTRIRYRVDRRASIKDVLESLGIPHVEVYGLRVQGRDAGLGRLLSPGDRVEVFPGEPPVDVTQPTLLRPHALRELRFVVDENVAGLAPLLRGLGFDAAYERTWDDAHIAALARDEGRVVLSRDRALLKRADVQWGRLVRANHPEEQLLEVSNFFYSPSKMRPFTRCLRCNVELRPVEKSMVLHRLEPKTRKHYDEFSVCTYCGRVYWQGSHQSHMLSRYRRLGLVRP